ncbi:hypothetical protein JVU11DRAFT_8541 [Chiua virens]|nr:hypothetical protein JVU11DRAFT_8541 [Chiua virens]
MIASKISFNSSGTGYVLQRSFYIGITITNILYGIELLLYFETMRILLTTRRTSKKSSVFYLVFNNVILVLVTIWVATQALFGEEIWILDARYPGNPDQYWDARSSTCYMDCGTTAAVLLQLMTDALMIYRCQVIWAGYRVIIVPLILWLATLVLGILLDWTVSSPGDDDFTFSSRLSFAYYTVAVFLNITVTCLICYRILRHGREAKEHLGHEYARLYFTIVTLIVECVFPYTFTGIAFLVSLGIGSLTSIAFISVYISMMCISPQMLILHIIMGKARENDTSGQSGSSLKFSPQSIETTTQPFGPNVDSDEIDCGSKRAEPANDPPTERLASVSSSDIAMNV